MANATETKQKIAHYELMFLASQAQAAMLGGLLQHIQDILARAEADILALRKWDDRRLAYEIDKQKRGVYFLAYIACDPELVRDIERACNISEQIMRVIIVKADHLSEDEMRAADDRDTLANEARVRGERAPEEEQRASNVTIGRPEDQREREEEPAAEQSEEEQSDEEQSAEESSDEESKD